MSRAKRIVTAPTFFTGKKNHNLLSVLTECCPFLLKIHF